MSNVKHILVSIFLSASLTGCFTGVESTPKITYSDVKKEHIETTDEQRYLADVHAEPPSDWKRGKKFYVTDSRIALILTADVPVDSASLVGSTLTFIDVKPAPTVTGEDVAMIDFVTDSDGSAIRYKTQIPYSELQSKAYLDIPYAIDLDIVTVVSAKVKGKSYFITTPLWYNAEDDRAVNGLRHVEVVVDEVVAGNDNYPIKVIFHPAGSDRQYAVFMTVGSRRTATRNFDTLFAFENPRLKYPNIEEDDWRLITHSKVRIGMSRDECRLALGAPKVIGQRPTLGGMVEYWSYADGTYLFFDEGFLSSFRH